MNVDKAVFAFAGLFILTGTALSYFLKNDWFLIMPAFAGLNMLQAAITGFCPAAMIFKALGLKSGCAFQ